MIEHSDQSEHALSPIASKFSHTENMEDQPSNAPINRMALSTDQTTVPTGHRSLTSLSLDSIKVPAILIDRQLRIAWQNKSAQTQIWLQASSINSSASQPFLFDLLFDPLFQNKVENWRQWVAFFLRHAQGVVPPDELKQLIEQQSDRPYDVLQTMLVDTLPAYGGSLFSGRIRQVLTTGPLISFWVVAADFAEGRLLVFDQTVDASVGVDMAKSGDLDQRWENVKQLSQPAKQPFYVLAARLNQADTLRTEMLAEEYSRLLNRVWKATIEIIEQSGGIVNHPNSSSLLGYFLPLDNNDTTPQQLVQCALELKAQMVELGREWKIRKGWLHNIELNMGLHFGEEFMGTIQSSTGDILMTFGDTLQVASCLAQLATNGQIWATKILVNQLPSREVKQLRFGIFRHDGHHQVFIARYFSRVSDLTGIGDRLVEINDEIGRLAVTQIFDRQIQI